MRRWLVHPVSAIAPAVMLTACVTINVYFPAAEAREAARQFVEKVISTDDATVKPGEKPRGQGAFVQPAPAGTLVASLARIDFASLIGIGSAQAQGQPDITLKTPAIQSIEARMEQRFDSTLRAGFDAGALGFSADGLVVVHDAAKLGLKDRVSINQAVAEDNRDRKAVYREIAVANGHAEWEPRIREVFAKQWIESARSGWWYQSGGGWKQK